MIAGGRVTETSRSESSTAAAAARRGESPRDSKIRTAAAKCRGTNAGTADGEPCRSCNHTAWDRELDLNENIEMIGERHGEPDHDSISPSRIP